MGAAIPEAEDVVLVPIAQIVVGERRRGLQIARIPAIATSIRQIGLQTPITVTPGLALVYGLHRVEACKSLGWPTIPAFIRDLNPLDAELAEIDENLQRADLSALEYGEHFVRRQEIYLEKYPETASPAVKGGPGRGHKTTADSALVSTPAFTETASALTGKSRRTVEDTMHMVRDIVPEARDLIRETEAADNKTELRALGKFKADPEVQVKAARLVSTGEVPTVRQAILALKQDPALASRIPARAADEDAPLSHQEDYDSDEWYTPEEYIVAARKVMGAIDLDPASCDAAQRTVGAARYYTKADDGLKQEWSGRVWLNPPYSQPSATQFGKKLLAEIDADRVTEAVMVQNASTDTAWFHALAQRARVCLTRGRINFNREDGGSSANRYGQAFFYFGKHEKRFEEVFGAYGLVGRLKTTRAESEDIGE